MIRLTDDFVIASHEVEKTCTAVECCETLPKNVVVVHSLCRIGVSACRRRLWDANRPVGRIGNPSGRIANPSYRGRLS
jgi:hypothetical protein